MRADPALQRARGQVWALRQSVPDLLFEIDASGRVLYAQLPCSAPIKGPAARWLGRTLFDIWPGEPARICREALQEAQLTGRSTGRCIQVVHRAQAHSLEVDLIRCSVPGSRPNGPGRYLLVLRHAAAANRELQHLAFFDALTGLPNRRLLLDRLEQAVHDTQRTLHWGAVLFVDLDGFKAVNDIWGHAAGDQLLRQAGQRIAEVLRRSSDTVARWGGDEFVVLLRHLGRQAPVARGAVERVAGQLVQAMHQPYGLERSSVRLSASIGAVLFGGGPVFSAEDLLQQADRAMYLAKSRGRDTWCIQPPVAPERPLALALPPEPFTPRAAPV